MSDSAASAEPFDMRRGAILMVVSALMFAAMAASVRVAARELPNAPIVFFRHYVMLVFLLPWLLRQGRHALDTDDFRGHLVRSLAGVFAGVLDWLIWGSLPDLVFVAGAVLVVAAATLALRIHGGAPVLAAAAVDPALRRG